MNTNTTETHLEAIRVLDEALQARIAKFDTEHFGTLQAKNRLYRQYREWCQTGYEGPARQSGQADHLMSQVDEELAIPGAGSQEGLPAEEGLSAEMRYRLAMAKAKRERDLHSFNFYREMLNKELRNV